MFVKVKQTRHTKIGILRSGTILDVNQLSENGQSLIAALLKQENPALVKLTKAQADAEKEAVVSLVPVDEPVVKTSIDQAVLEELQKTLSDAAELNSTLQADLDKAVKAGEDGAELAANLQADLKSVSVERDKLAATVVSETKRADDAEAAIKSLEEDLTESQKALSSATEETDGEGK